MTTPISFSMNVHRIVKIEITELQEGKTDNHWRWINLIDEDGQTHSIAVHGDPFLDIPEPSSVHLLRSGLVELARDVDSLREIIKPEAE